MHERKLAVFSPYLGVPTETFIRRHLHELAPSRTVAVTRFDRRASTGQSNQALPVLVSAGRISLVRRFPLFKRWMGDGVARLDEAGIKQFLIKQNVCVLLGEYLDESWPLIPLARDLGLKFFVHAHGYDLSINFRNPQWRERYVDYAKTSGVIVVNEVMRTRLELIGIPRNLIHLIPYGVDVPNEHRVRSQKSFVRYLAVGRMVPKKAPLVLLEAFRHAAQVDPGLSLDVVGDGPLLEEARKFVKWNALEDRVTLHGACRNDDVIHLMDQSDCFVQHSVEDKQTGDEEGLPVAILEAMAASLPVIATRHAGIPEAVVHQETGLLVDEGDVDGMAQHITFLGKEHEKRIAMGISGWNRAKKYFTWEREKQQLRALLNL